MFFVNSHSKDYRHFLKNRYTEPRYIKVGIFPLDNRKLQRQKILNAYFYNCLILKYAFFPKISFMHKFST